MLVSGTDRRTRRPLWRRALGALLILVLAYVAVTFGQVAVTANVDRAQPAQAIVVLGAAQYQGQPSPVFTARLDHAAALYAAGIADTVVVTGGRQPGDSQSEANAADRYLQAQGVPAAALLLENTSSTTYESLAASSVFLADRGITEIVLVSDGWHLARSAEIARSVGLTAHTSPTTASLYSTGSALQQMVRETGGLAVGRLIGFRRLDRLTELTVADLADVVGRRTVALIAG